MIPPSTNQHSDREKDPPPCNTSHRRCRLSLRNISLLHEHKGEQRNQDDPLTGSVPRFGAGKIHIAQRLHTQLPHLRRMQRLTNRREISKPIALVDYSNGVCRGGRVSGWLWQIGESQARGGLVIARGGDDGCDSGSLERGDRIGC